MSDWFKPCKKCGCNANKGFTHYKKLFFWVRIVHCFECDFKCKVVALGPIKAINKALNKWNRR